MPVAVKVYDKQKQFDNEVQFYSALNGLSHPHIISCMAHAKSLNSKPVIVQQKAEFGNLLENLMHIETMKEAVAITLQIAYALNFLHKSAVKTFHRDLKAENILVNSINTWSVQLCDFGISQIGQDCPEAVGTFPYMSPQFLEKMDKHEFTSKTEVFAFGVLMWEIFCGYEMKIRSEGVYPGMQPVQILFQVINDDLRP